MLSKCREEVLAYAEAVRNVEHIQKVQRQHLSRLASQNGGTVPLAALEALPAPELQGGQPTLRVRHYMNKLQSFLMVSASKRLQYDAAATTIQRFWNRCRERRKLSEMKQMVR